ncbi:MAG: GNAT family N-acetyltransferase [Chloroflexi bacterium]|nr:GNAT family N-acetyltransferase [Chloroflexota bacterium]
MIRSLTLADMVRLVSLKDSEWVVRRGRVPEALSQSALSGHPPFALPAFLLDRFVEHHRENIFGAIDGGRITGLASACRRAGSTSWGVCQLVVVRDDEQSCGKLLETLAGHAGEHGAERLFLLLPDEGRLVDEARKSGFSPCTSLMVFTLVGRAALVGATPLQRHRPRLSGDDHALYRIYNATTTAEVRKATGLTLQQWADAQEPRSKRTRELVVEEDGEIRAWVRLDPRRGYVRVQSMIDPLWREDLRSLVALVLDQAGSRGVQWEVPAHQESLRQALERVGFQMSGTYRLMVKLLVAQIKEPATVPVSA